MLDVFNILVSNGASWGIALTLIIAGLIVAVILLYRDDRRLEAAQTELSKELSDIKEKIYDKFDKLEDKIEQKLDKIYDYVNKINATVSEIKGNMGK